YDEAQQVLEEAYGLQIKVLGANHPNTELTVSRLAAVYLHSGQEDLAMVLYEGLAGARRKRYGADHPETIWAVQELGFAYINRGWYESAAEVAKQVPRKK